MEVFNSARSSPLRLQLLRARDFKSFLFESDLMKAIPPSPFSYKSLCVKNKSVSLVLTWRPSAKRDIDAGLIWLWLMKICWIFVLVLNVSEIGWTCSSPSLFLRRFKFLRGRILKSSLRVSPLILLLSMSILLKFYLFFNTSMSAWAPSLSISLFDN